MRRLPHLVASCLLLCGCFGPGEGVEVPLDQIYFPVGLALHQTQEGDEVSADYLYVVSSDFDLQYNGGAIQSYDLNKLHAELPRICSDSNSERCEAGETCRGGLCRSPVTDSPCAHGERSDADRLLYPVLCAPIDPKPLALDSVKIGAFATDAIIRSGSNFSEQRLLVPVRGDSTLHWLDLLDAGKLDCGQGGNGACDSRHRAGDDPYDNVRGLELGPEPFAIDASEHAENIIVTNQTTGTAALFTTEIWGDGPKLQFALSSGNIPQRPVGVAAVPPLTSSSASDTFLLTFRDSAQVRLFRATPDAGSVLPRPYLADGGGVAITANSVGTDSRGIAIDDSARKAAQALCAADDEACLSQAALVALDVYVASRAPSSLLIGRTQPPQQYPYFFDTLPLTSGPSRVVIGKVWGVSGEPETRVFVVCFESRKIFVYDPRRARIESEIVTGRGPHAVAIDEKRRLLYVGHFTDSYIGVYSLDQEFPDTYGTMLGMLGTPKAPRSSK